MKTHTMCLHKQEYVLTSEHVGTESGWDGINFPYSSPHSGKLYICSWSKVDKMAMFWLLVSSACTAVKLSLQPTFPKTSSLGVG